MYAFVGFIFQAPKKNGLRSDTVDICVKLKAIAVIFIWSLECKVDRKFLIRLRFDVFRDSLGSAVLGNVFVLWFILFIIVVFYQRLPIDSDLHLDSRKTIQYSHCRSALGVAEMLSTYYAICIDTHVSIR